MKITVLIENNSRIDNYLIAEPGLSLLVEEGERKVLFDTGYSDAFIKNAKKLHIDLNKVTDIVISHGHNDHTRGLAFLNLTGTNLYAHPNIFDVKIDENNLRYGCPISQNELSNRYNLILSKKPVAISENIVFLGEIPGNKSQDIDDTALAFKGEKGVFIITGCSHSGIINIIKYAKQVCQTNDITGIFGGFHLLNQNDEELERFCLKLKSELKNQNILNPLLYPCHCCDLNSKIAMSKFFDIQEVCTGDIFML